MDADQFDALARSISAGLGSTRRTLLASLATLVPSRLFEHTAWAKKRHHKKHKRKKKKKKKCKHPPCGSPCTVSDDGVTVAAQRQFKGKTLRAVQTIQSIADQPRLANNLTLTLAGASLLTIDVEGANGVVTVNVTYGDAFQGVRRATFTNDGATVTGEIDGRATAPLPADGDPNSLTFADGSPLPDLRVEPDLASAIGDLLRQSQQGADGCAAAGQGQKDAKTKRSPRAHPENSLGCLKLYIPCEAGYIGCMAGVGGGCVLTLLGYAACVAIGLAACFYASMQCRKSVRYSESCCPVRCGGSDVLDVFGEDPSCCERGETCLDANDSNSGCCIEGTRSCHGRSCCFDDQDCEDDGICCLHGSSSCGGDCCPDGSCTSDGFCCAPPSGVACGDTCCPPFTRSCCNGACCDSDCIDDRICCRTPNQPCRGSRGEACCPQGKCCDGICCGSDETCQNNQCVVACNPDRTVTCPNEPGYPTCCEEGTLCCRGGQCCPLFLPVCCGDGCCLASQECCPDNVCRDNCLH